MLGLVWSTTSAAGDCLGLPSSEDLAAWRDATTASGVCVAHDLDGDRASAQGSHWVVHVRDASGALRSLTVAPPRSAAARLDLLQLVASARRPAGNLGWAAPPIAPPPPEPTPRPRRRKAKPSPEPEPAVVETEPQAPAVAPEPIELPPDHVPGLDGPAPITIGRIPAWTWASLTAATDVRADLPAAVGGAIRTGLRSRAGVRVGVGAEAHLPVATHGLSLVDAGLLAGVWVAPEQVRPLEIGLEAAARHRGFRRNGEPWHDGSYWTPAATADVALGIPLTHSVLILPGVAASWDFAPATIGDPADGPSYPLAPWRVRAVLVLRAQADG